MNTFKVLEGSVMCFSAMVLMIKTFGSCRSLPGATRFEGAPGARDNLRLSPLIPPLWTIDVTLPPVHLDDHSSL